MAVQQFIPRAPGALKLERAAAAERAMKSGDYLNPLVAQYLREQGQEIEQERRRLARELWELRHEWPHRVEMRTRAANVSQMLFCRLGVKICASCPHKKSP